MPEPFLVLGESLVDVVASADGAAVERPGGSPANVAVALARLGAGVALATALGADPRGVAVTRHLQASGVVLAEGSTMLERTSVAVAEVDREGSASYTFEIDPRLVVPTPSAARLHLHTGSIAAVLEPGATAIVEALRAHRPWATLSYDINARPAVTGTGAALRAGVERVAALADLVKASDEDLAVVYPGLELQAAAERLLDVGAGVVVVTRGGEGAVCLTRRHAVTVPGVPTAVADTIGAGDAFCAALLDGLAGHGLLGRDGAGPSAAPPAVWESVVARANAAAAITVSRPGADPPTAAELASVLAASGPSRTASYPPATAVRAK